MDMGIKGCWALVCAASKGLGRGCAEALAAEGVNLVITARGAEALARSGNAKAEAQPATQPGTKGGVLRDADGTVLALSNDAVLLLANCKLAFSVVNCPV